MKSEKQQHDGGEIIKPDSIIPKNPTSSSLHQLYEDWFLDYASYVILERAIPYIEDGLKPVQRRILHAIKEMDDGRFNKAANIIGQTMQYHPHGDASIGDAMVNLGQKELLIETQGNWGDVRTGDPAAAARYIEARLSKFALEVIYNPQITAWQPTYDGRKKEPITLPVKFPLLLAQGVEGIAVGLSTKILPHNFCELIKASIHILQDKKITLYPDFPTGGFADFTDYNQGARGGKVKVRAKIDIDKKDTLVIREIPYGTTTGILIDSITKANEKGKIKIKQVVDNTASDVEIKVLLQAGQSPEIAMEALYAFTDCETSMASNACVIVEGKPQFMAVTEILKYNTHRTVYFLESELKIKQSELIEKIFFASLEKIFIEKRIYRDIEECNTLEEVMSSIHRGLIPYTRQFYRDITQDDITKLTEIKIKRISKYDSFSADKQLEKWEQEVAQTRANLANLTSYAIDYYQRLLTHYGKDKKRRTTIQNFHSVMAHEVIATTQKLYVDRINGFVGWGLKKNEYLCDCSEIDDIIAIGEDGKAMVSKISEKVFMGKNILYAGLWKKGDNRLIYNILYVDGSTGKAFVKRCALSAVIRDRYYDLTQGTPKSKIRYLTVNPNGEAESIQFILSKTSRARKKIVEFDFSHIDIKGRGAKGNVLTPYPIKKITMMRSGTSTLGGIDLWFDAVTGRLNKEKRGTYVSYFCGEDFVFSVNKRGVYKLIPVDVNARFDADKKTLLIVKFAPDQIVTSLYYDKGNKKYYVKRFVVDTDPSDKEYKFISSSATLIYISLLPKPVVAITELIGKDKQKRIRQLDLSTVVTVKGWKAMGNLLPSSSWCKSITPLVPESPAPSKEETIATNKIQNKKNKPKSLSVGKTLTLDL